ncbi:hypothetical protein [Pseudodesulfovibrio sp. zrk46]|uniref:hypothetical protein n=1 Tax=Pseudodesulfovibrio sp. zrk46 TaxID=2725288 RepID=UPI001448BD79|nr:hypothetical protein [Pseudodesulfovibrio sp. zrk46]QJB56416.1 hypothetical protein HFN16_08315 [Pseudodesulfovibrio sp. zrk46]
MSTDPNHIHITLRDGEEKRISIPDDEDVRIEITYEPQSITSLAFKSINNLLGSIFRTLFWIIFVLILAYLITK